MSKYEVPVKKHRDLFSFCVKYYGDRADIQNTRNYKYRETEESLIKSAFP